MKRQLLNALLAGAGMSRDFKAARKASPGGVLRELRDMREEFSLTGEAEEFVPDELDLQEVVQGELVEEAFMHLQRETECVAQGELAKERAVVRAAMARAAWKVANGDKPMSKYQQELLEAADSFLDHENEPEPDSVSITDHAGAVVAEG
jgi:hypothetical protein